MTLKVLAVVPELYPLIKTGGLADVAGALPAALRAEGVAVTTLVPGYPAVLAALSDTVPVLADDDLFGGPARLLAGRAAGLDVLAIDAPHLYGRPGSPYLGPDGRDWPDNAFRFAALGWMAARIGLGDVPALAPDILHAHDWQAGLAMAYLTYDGRPGPATVMTVHNLAYQGRFPAELLGALRLPPQAYSIDGVEFYGGIGFLKAGLHFADRITTVSPTYAAEIQTPAEGCGLDGLMRARADALTGILNGIDSDEWNPATDRRIPSRYDRLSPEARRPNKTALQRRFGLTYDPGRLLFAVVSRLTWQKGLDLLADAAPALLAAGGQLAMIGTGDPDLEQRFRTLAAAHPGRIGCLFTYDEDLAHLLQAGADALLVPSRFEPCGLTQLCALRYGAVPVVTRVGGLADTVMDVGQIPGDVESGTGIQFNPVSREALEAALGRAAALWSDPALWARVQASGMAADVSWSQPAKRYASLYAGLLATTN